MHRRSQLASLLLLLLCAPLSAQRIDTAAARRTTVEGGVVAEFGVGGQSGSFTIYPGSPGCGLFDGADLLRGALGLTLRLPRLFGENLGLAAIAQWDQSRALYTARPLADQRIIDETTDSIVTIEREFRYHHVTTSAKLELGVLWHPHDWLGFSAGLAPGYAYRISGRQSDNIVGPGDRSFADGEKSRPMERGYIPDPSRFILSASLRATARIPFQSRFSLLAGLVGGVDLLPLEGNLPTGDLRGVHAGVSLGLIYDFTPSPPDTLPPPDTVRRDTTPPPPPPPIARLYFVGVDERDSVSSEGVITVSTTLRRRFTPMLPLVYYDSGAADPAERYTILSRSEAERFSIIPLLRNGPFELSHHILDLTGWRWHERGEPARVVLHGARSEDEPVSLARDRARRAADYLVNVWRIPRRLVEARADAGPLPLPAQTTEDGREENRRVAISSDDPDLLGPLEVEQAVREFNPPRIRLEPEISAPAGVRDWQIVLRQRDVELARFARGDSASGRRTWRLLDGSIDSALNVLVAELVATDSLGRSVTTTAQLILRTRRDTTLIEGTRTSEGERERVEWGLVGFGYRETEGGERHIAELADMAALARDTVTIGAVGTTDRVGDEESNRALSLRRAEWAVARLRALLAARGIATRNGAVTGAGVDLVRFPNEYPEGRVLSRGATVVMEQARER